MDALEAQRRFAAQICLTDMLAFEAGGSGSYELAERLIGQAHAMFQAAMRWQDNRPLDSEDREFIARLRARLRQVQLEFKAAKRPPTKADIEQLLQITFIRGVGVIPPNDVRDHLMAVYTATTR